jgi:hypothetical protein
MIESTRKLTAIKYAATLVGALAVVALALATAHALPRQQQRGRWVSLHGQGRLRHPNRRGPGRFRRRQDRELVAVERSSSPLRQRALAGAQSPLICRRKSISSATCRARRQHAEPLQQSSFGPSPGELVAAEAVAQQFADGHGNVRRPSGEVLRLLGRVPRSSLAGQTSAMLTGGCMLMFARVCMDHSVHSHGHWSAPRDESRISPRTPAIASRGQYFPLPGPKLGAYDVAQFRM